MNIFSFWLFLLHAHRVPSLQKGNIIHIWICYVVFTLNCQLKHQFVCCCEPVNVDDVAGTGQRQIKNHWEGTMVEGTDRAWNPRGTELTVIGMLSTLQPVRGLSQSCLHVRTVIYSALIQTRLSVQPWLLALWTRSNAAAAPGLSSACKDAINLTIRTRFKST